MKSQTIRFEKMNSDIAPKFLPEGNYISMENCRPNNTNSGAGFVVENIPSTLAVTPPSFGQSVVRVGGCLDYKRTSIIAFYRGATAQFITSMNVDTKTESILVNSTVMDFSKQITHAGVLDDFLYFVDGANKLRKINIPLAISDTQQDVFSSDDMLIDKFPPLEEPSVSAQQDDNVETNNITNSIFQFCYAWEYDGKELSSWSPLSVSVMPESADDHTFDNNCIDITLRTGSSFVKKIHIAYRIGESGKFKLTEILDKRKEVIGDDTVYTYRFYNSKFISPLEKTDVLAYTNNPFFEFGSMAISRDNFIIAGWVKDGLEKPTDLDLTLSYNVMSTNTRRCTHKTGAVHEFGVVFHDENGRTDGVNARATIEIPFLTSTENGMRGEVISASALSGFFPYVTISYSLTGTIPLWAKSMSFVYLGNKTLSTFIQYTLSDISDAGDFTYLDITALNSINSTISVLEPISQSTNISAYTFTKGDRIRFIREDGGSLLSGIYDYEILGYVPEVTDSSGNVLYQNTIFVNQFDWSAASIGKNSLFEIYTPKKEYADNVFFEIGETVVLGGEAGSGGDPLNMSGTLQCGDAYVFERTMNIYDLAEYVSDKDFTIDYNGPFTTSVYYRPSLNLIKVIDGASATVVGQFTNPTTAYFYRNTTGASVNVDVSGKYDITFETDGGLIFALDATNSGGGNIFNKEFFSVSGLSGVQRITKNGNIKETIVLPNNAGIYFSFRAIHKLKIDTPVVLDFSIKVRSGSAQVINFVESKNYSDYYASDEHSFGRPFTEVEEDLTTKNNIVYSGKYFADTDINETNKFNAVDVKYVPYEFGYINLMRIKGDTLKVFTPNKEMSFYLGKEAYNSGGDTNSLVYVSNAIGTINAYDSDFGTENPESCLSVANSIYYYDRKNASIVRTSNNGQENIERFGQSTELRRITKLINAASSYNVFIGYNDKNYEVVVCFVIDGAQQTLVFKESDNAWTHRLAMEDVSTNPIEGLINYGENMVAYLGGRGYLWEQGTTYSTFFGDTKSPVIECVVNQEPISTKIFQSLSYQGTGQWNIQVETEPNNILPYGQYTQILKGRQKIKEGFYWSDITPNLKDKNNIISSLRYAKGQPMRGRYATLTMTNEDTTRVLLDEVTVNYIDSPL